MQSDSVRNEIKQAAQTMETLAHEIQVRLESGTDILALANELVRNSSTFVFSLGEMYALERVSTSRKTKSKSTVSASTHNYRHNLRDPHTKRFIRKV